MQRNSEGRCPLFHLGGRRQRINVDPRGTFPRRGVPPSNKSMELTIKSVTPFAFAKAAPLLSAADPRR